MKFKLFTLAALIAAILVAGLSEGAYAKGTKLQIALTPGTGFAAAKGKATYKAAGGEREFQVEVENIKKLAGKSLAVYVSGAKVGKMSVSALGTAKLNLNTDNGNLVPHIVAGSTVQIKTGAGALVASGKF